MNVFILCTTAVQNTAQETSDNLQPYSPDNHHSLDIVCCRERGL